MGTIATEPNWALMSFSDPTLGLTEHRDLRGGRSSWIADDDNTTTADALPDGAVDVLGRPGGSLWASTVVVSGPRAGVRRHGWSTQRGHRDHPRGSSRRPA